MVVRIPQSRELKSEVSSFHFVLCSIQEGDLQSLAPRVPPQNLTVVKKKREIRKDPSPGLREQRRKRSTGQGPNTPAVTMTRLMVLCHFQDSLGA